VPGIPGIPGILAQNEENFLRVKGSKRFIRVAKGGIFPSFLKGEIKNIEYIRSQKVLGVNFYCDICYHQYHNLYNGSIGFRSWG
jgi:hypothetical protein